VKVARAFGVVFRFIGLCKSEKSHVLPRFACRRRRNLRADRRERRRAADADFRSRAGCTCTVRTEIGSRLNRVRTRRTAAEREAARQEQRQVVDRSSRTG
jgi:hypothetical protein